MRYANDPEAWNGDVVSDCHRFRMMTDVFADRSVAVTLLAETLSTGAPVF
jgi:hypothetical protein